MLSAIFVHPGSSFPVSESSPKRIVDNCSFDDDILTISPLRLASLQPTCQSGPSPGGTTAKQVVLASSLCSAKYRTPSLVASRRELSLSTCSCKLTNAGRVSSGVAALSRALSPDSPEQPLSRIAARPAATTSGNDTRFIFLPQYRFHPTLQHGFHREAQEYENHDAQHSFPREIPLAGQVVFESGWDVWELNSLTSMSMPGILKQRDCSDRPFI